MAVQCKLLRDKSAFLLLFLFHFITQFISNYSCSMKYYDFMIIKSVEQIKSIYSEQLILKHYIMFHAIAFSKGKVTYLERPKLFSLYSILNIPINRTHNIKLSPVWRTFLTLRQKTFASCINAIIWSVHNSLIKFF